MNKSAPEKKKEQIRRMFNSIAHRYDFLNHFLSLGIDRRWRKRLVKLVKPEKPELILDVATGTADLAIEALKTREDDPFMMWVHLFDPHMPYKTHPGSPFESYESEVHYTDQQIGRILQELQDEGLLDTTIITLVSDHGEGFGEWGFIGHGLDLYDESMRVPMLISVPGVEPRDIVDTVGAIDLTPTILDLLGLPQPESMQGYSLLPLLDGTRSWERPPVFLETWRFRGATEVKDLHLVGAVANDSKVILDLRLGAVGFFDIPDEGRETMLLEIEEGSPDWKRFGPLAADLLRWRENSQ